MVQVARWPSVSLRQPWVDGLPLDLARLWAHSYGNEPSSGLMVGQSKSQGCRKGKIYLALLCSSPWTDAHLHHGPAFRTWKLYLFFPSSLSLSLFLSIVWVNWESCRITAWQFLPVVWFLIITFIFLFWKKYKEITVPTKMISTYQKSCRTSYTSFYCITVSL